MLQKCIKATVASGRTVWLAVAIATLLSACSSVGFNEGRGAWNAPEHVYQPAWLKRKYVKAVKPMTKGDYEKAAVNLEEFVENYPGYPGAHVNLAISYDKLERPDDAYAQLDVAEELIDNYPPALNQRGAMQRRKGDFTAAEKSWKRAVKEDPAYLNGWYNLGVLYDLYLQDLPQALSSYEEYQRQLVSGGENDSFLGLGEPTAINEPDPEVQRWIVDLERRIGTTQATQASEAL